VGERKDEAGSIQGPTCSAVLRCFTLVPNPAIHSSLRPAVLRYAASNDDLHAAAGRLLAATEVCDGPLLNSCPTILVCYLPWNSQSEPPFLLPPPPVPWPHTQMPPHLAVCAALYVGPAVDEISDHQMNSYTAPPPPIHKPATCGRVLTIPATAVTRSSGCRWQCPILLVEQVRLVRCQLRPSYTFGVGP
jgi:hypothetical protein